MEKELKKQVEEAKKIIKDGGIVVFPTETAYGIAADATNPEAIEKVYQAKNRPKSKGLTAIVNSLDAAKEFSDLSDKEVRLIEEFMPGPLTLVAEKKESVPENLNTHFAFRISSSDISSKLASSGPITATSANISGNETSYSVEDISNDLLDAADFVIDSGRLDSGPTSTIAEVVDGEVVVHREGPIKKKELEKHV